MSSPTPLKADPASEAAAAELLRRRRARGSLEDFAQAIDVPGRPVSEDLDAWLFEPVETQLALHHRVILRALQQCMSKPYGRLMIFAPPGSAKSSYASVVAPTWYMGQRPDARIILTSYATSIAIKQSRRARQICRSAQYAAIFGTQLPHDQSAVESWALSNGSEFMAAGILAGITGNRADGIIIDDPVAGREEAESDAIRSKTWDAYNDDVLTRLKPKGWVVLMMTRWSLNDLAGMLLPEDYDGVSGPVHCRDGRIWEVIRLPARADHEDDPAGREIGEYLWPEWFDHEHWRSFESATTPSGRRTWAALYQQTPMLNTGTVVERGWFQWYDPEDLPKPLITYLATDFAVTEKGGDWTEMGVWGVSPDGDLWALDWWFGQVTSDASIKAAMALIKQHKPRCWYGERGVIEAALGPAIERAMWDDKVRCARVLLPTIGDKLARLQAFRGYVESGRVHLPRTSPWAQRLLDQLLAFPAGAHDDGVDVCGMIGRAVNQMSIPRAPTPRKAPVVPFSAEWVEYQDRIAAQQRAERQRYLT